MPPLDTIFQFAIAALIIIVVPGPSVIFTISRGITLGRRAAVANVAGNTIGAMTCALLVSIGLGPIIARSTLFFDVLKFVGAGYLVYLGVTAIRDRRKLTEFLDGVLEPISTRVVVRQGFIVGITNPKIYIFFAAVLPQYVDRASGGTVTQMIVLAGVFGVIGFASDSVWGVAAGTIREWISNSPRRLEAIGGAGGLALVGLGIHLALSRSTR